MFHSSSSEWRAIFYLDLLTLVIFSVLLYFLEFLINFAQYLFFSVESGVFYLANGIVRLPKSQAHAWMQAITGEHFA